MEYRDPICQSCERNEGSRWVTFDDERAGGITYEVTFWVCFPCHAAIAHA